MAIRHRFTVSALLAALLATPLLAAEKNEEIVKSFPARSGKVVLVDAGPLDLQVRSAEIPDIRVRIQLSAAAFNDKEAQSWLDAHRPTIEDSEPTLRITAPDPKGISLMRGVIISKARVELTLPPSVRPDLSTSSGNLTATGEFSAAAPLRLRSASGDIEFDGWASDVEARSTSGDIQLQASRAFGSLLARTASGEVSLAGGAHTVRCDASSGDVRLEGLLGSASVATESGAVTLRFDTLAPTDQVKVTTTSGRIRVTLPPGAQPGGDVTSGKGEIHSVYPGQSDPKGGRLVLAGGGPRLVIVTTSGRVGLL